MIPSRDMGGFISSEGGILKRNSSWLKLQPCFLIGGDHWKGVIIWLHRKGGGLERYSLLYLKCRANFWTILEYLLYSLFIFIKHTFSVCKESSEYSTRYRQRSRFMAAPAPKHWLCVFFVHCAFYCVHFKSLCGHCVSYCVHCEVARLAF